MNKYVFAVISVVLGTLIIAVPLSLKYSEATLLFGFIAAPIVVHKIPNVGYALGILIGLSAFASFPLKKLFQIDGFAKGILVTLAYVAILWVIGFGWKRNWR